MMQSSVRRCDKDRRVTFVSCRIYKYEATDDAMRLNCSDFFSWVPLIFVSLTSERWKVFAGIEKGGKNLQRAKKTSCSCCKAPTLDDGLFFKADSSILAAAFRRFDLRYIALERWKWKNYCQRKPLFLRDGVLVQACRSERGNFENRCMLCTLTIHACQATVLIDEKGRNVIQRDHNSKWRRTKEIPPTAN